MNINELVRPRAVGSMCAVWELELLGVAIIYYKNLFLTVNHDVVKFKVCVDVSRGMDTFIYLYQLDAYL